MYRIHKSIPFGILISCISFFLSCAGTQFFVYYNNETDYFAALALERTGDGEVFVMVATPHSQDTDNVEREEQFTWKVRLYQADELLFSDSGEIFVSAAAKRCTIEPDTGTTFSVSWGE